jgi:hypothetical protein
MDKKLTRWPFNIRGNFCTITVYDLGGLYNALNYPNIFAFAALKADGSITAWGHSSYGGTGAPSDNGYTKIYSTGHAFAALGCTCAFITRCAPRRD